MTGCQSIAMSSGHLLLIKVWSLAFDKSLVTCFVVPPALELVHFSKWEVWQRINSMEAAYSQLIDWSPSTAVPAPTSSQWGDNILVVGDPKRQSASKVKSLIADSSGFALNGELHNVSGYLRSHGGFELELVGSSQPVASESILVTCSIFFWSLGQTVSDPNFFQDHFI